MLLLSLLSGYLAVYIWYRLVKVLRNEKEAFYSSIMIMLFPYFFAANTNLMYESFLLLLQITSLYLVVSSTLRGRLQVDTPVKITIGGILWGLSQSLFIGSLALLPVCFYYILRSKSHLISLILFISSGILTSIGIDLLSFGNLFLLFQKYSLFIYIPNYDEKYSLSVFILRIIRNWLFHPLMVLSLSGFAILILSMGKLFRDNKKQFLEYAVWLAPFIALTQYWGGWMIGRISLFLIFPASLIITQAFKDKRLRIIIILIILPTTIYYASGQKQKSPLDNYFSLIKDIQARSAVMTSDYNRFLYVQHNIPIYIYRGISDNTSQEEEFIKENLKKGKTVLIDSNGLRFPYYQIDSDFYQILSLGKIGVSQTPKILSKYDFKLYSQSINNKEIYFFEIMGLAKTRKVIEPEVFYTNNFYYINQNKPYKFDPLANFLYLISRKKDPEYWWYGV